MLISPGKFIGFRRIANDDGVLQMLALDQRQSLFKLLQEQEKDEEKQKTAIKNIKKNILKTLSEHVSAVLVDGEYAAPELFQYVHPKTGIILSIEKSGYVEEGQNRLNKLFRSDAVEVAKKWGCDAVKLLIYWNNNVPIKVKEIQEQLVKNVGEKTKEFDILFILEIVTYGKLKGKKELILSGLKNFSSEEYGVDLFKIEPFTESISTNEIFEATSGKPWVILSGGADIKNFLPVLEKNQSLGASGFLVGRVIWKNAVKYFYEDEKMEFYLKTSGIKYLSWIKEKSKYAMPWFMTPFFNGFEQIRIIKD